MTALFQQIKELDILINNAGIGLVGSVEETALPDFQRLFRVNVDGTFLMTRAAIPLLLVFTWIGCQYRIGSGCGRSEAALCLLRHEGGCGCDDTAIGC